MPIAEIWEMRSGRVATLRPFYWDTAALNAALA
jgi:ketosteroid isomerase-like protein